MIKLFNEKSRVVKNEAGNFLWKVSNGYKMSRNARIMLGIPEDTIHNIAIGTSSDDSTLVINAVDSKEEGNCVVSRNNLIMSKKVTTKLASFGDKFEITNDKLENFYIMNVVVAPSTTDTVEEKLEELVEEEEQD